MFQWIIYIYLQGLFGCLLYFNYHDLLTMICFLRFTPYHLNMRYITYLIMYVRFFFRNKCCKNLFDLFHYYKMRIAQFCAWGVECRGSLSLIIKIVFSKSRAQMLFFLLQKCHWLSWIQKDKRAHSSLLVCKFKTKQKASFLF